MDAFHEARKRVGNVKQPTLSLNAALEPDRTAGAAFEAISKLE